MPIVTSNLSGERHGGRNGVRHTLRRVMTHAMIGAMLLADLAPLAMVRPASAQTPLRAQIMTRVEYEACQARNDEAFREAIEKLTNKGLEAGLANLDYNDLIKEAWRRQNLDDVVDKLVDQAVEEVKSESSWGQLIGSLWTREKAQALAVSVAERVYKSDGMKRALEGLATDIGTTLGKRIETATVATAEPAVECLEVFLGPRYGRTIARVVSRDAGKEYAVDSTTGQGGASPGAVISQNAGGITGAIILLMRRQLANLASRIGARIVGSVLSRLVSVAAGGVGVVLIAVDIWSLRNGVLPIIATEMKSKETKSKVQEELAKEVREQISENLREISAQTANRVLEIWQDFKKSHATVIALSEKNATFRAFVDRLLPEQLPRLNEAVGIIARHEGEAALEKRLVDGSLKTIVETWEPAAFEIAREQKSIAIAEAWRKVAGKDLARVVELDLHKSAKPEAFTPQSLARLLALGDTLAMTRLSRVDDQGRNAILDLGPADARALARALDDKELVVLGAYVPKLSSSASARLLRAVATTPATMKTLARPSVLTAVTTSRDQNAALSMVLAQSTLFNPVQMFEHLRFVTDGRVSPILFWEKHPGTVGALAVALLLTLLMLKRLLFRPRPRVIVERRVEVVHADGTPAIKTSSGSGKAAGPFKGPGDGPAPSAPPIRSRNNTR